MHFVKDIHIGFAVVTLCGFLLRGYWMVKGSALLNHRWVRVVPHLVDTCLFLSGLTLVVAWRLYPTSQSWLAAKLLALVIYIVLGSIALKRGKTRTVRVAALLSAVVVFAYILAVAVTHDPLILR